MQSLLLLRNLLLHPWLLLVESPSRPQRGQEGVEAGALPTLQLPQLQPLWMLLHVVGRYTLCICCFASFVTFGKVA